MPLLYRHLIYVILLIRQQETRIQLNEQNNPKFNFLKPGDPYNAYYQFKVWEIRETGNQAPITQVNGTINNRTTNNATQQTNEV